MYFDDYDSLGTGGSMRGLYAQFLRLQQEGLQRTFNEFLLDVKEQQLEHELIKSNPENMQMIVDFEAQERAAQLKGIHRTHGNRKISPRTQRRLPFT